MTWIYVVPACALPHPHQALGDSQQGKLWKTFDLAYTLDAMFKSLYGLVAI